MTGFSLTDTALEGLRITRERPTAVLWWWLVWLLAALAQPLLLLLPAFRATPDLLVQFQAAQTALLTNPGDAAADQRMLAMFTKVGPALYALSGVELLAQLVVSTAVMRAVLRPAERKFGALRLSPDELRQLGLAAIALGAFVIYLVVVSIAVSLVLGLLGANPAMVILIGTVVMLWAGAYPAVRLSLAPPMTLADSRIRFRGAWALTKGRFTVLLGAYAIAMVIALALNLAVKQPVAMALVLAGGPKSPALVVDFKAMSSPFVLIEIVVGALLKALTSAVLTAPLASAFRQLTGRVGAPLGAMPANEGSPWG
jgi:hypothetical protein